MGFPVNSMYDEIFLGTVLASGIPGVEQNKPTELPGTENRDFLVATEMSHMATNWQPAAAAIPST